MIIDKDGQGLFESYISALQKIKNVKHRVTPRQPDDHHETETLEDRMHGDSESDSNTTQDAHNDENNENVPAAKNKTEASTQTTLPSTSPAIAVITLNTHEDDGALSMIKNDLYNIAKTAQLLYNLACQNSNFEPWMLGKISICSDSLSNILKVAEYDFKTKS